MAFKNLSEKEELNHIYAELRRSNKHLKKFVSIKHTFIRGLASGLGALLGATLVLTIILWFLSQLQFVPIIGNFALQIVEFVQANTKYSVPLGRNL